MNSSPMIGRDLRTEDVERVRHLHDARIASASDIRRPATAAGDRRIAGLGIGVGHVLAVDADLHAGTRRRRSWS